MFLGPCSNGEYDPDPLGPVAREAQRMARVDAEATARRLGIDRRRFLRSVCGAAVGLLALDACSKSSGGGKGGRYSLPKAATTEPEAARSAVSGDEFVFDVQTHLLEGDGRFGAVFPQARCGDDNCFDIEHYLEHVFVRSDTSLAVLSAVPGVDYEGPLSIKVMEETRRVAAAARCDDRLLLHGQVIPTRVDNGEHMARIAADHPISAWKAYTHVPQPWRLDDATGEAFLAKAAELGIPRVCVHKGFGGGSPAASPVDVGPAAKKHPDIDFVVYHSGYEAGQPQAVDRLVQSLADAGIGPNANVYAELGSTWWNLMRAPDDAARVLGTLLKAVGEDNVVWGTDSIWYGSPQDQLQAFRAFEITPEFQERFGYPALTKEVKAKILGLNSARLYGVKPDAMARCRFTRRELEDIRTDLPAGSALGPRTAAAAAAVRAGDWAWQRV